MIMEGIREDQKCEDVMVTNLIGRERLRSFITHCNLPEI